MKFLRFFSLLLIIIDAKLQQVVDHNTYFSQRSGNKLVRYKAVLCVV